MMTTLCAASRRVVQARLGVFLGTFVVVVAFAVATIAQTTQTAVDYATWEPIAQRAEEAVDTAKASDRALEDLRVELTGWREVFQAAREQSVAPIAAVKAQLEALGPKPAEGQNESDDIAAQRKALNERLTTLQAPGKAAEVAYSRADALIGQIDRILRERQADQLLELGAAPVNPVNWPPAIKVVADFVTRGVVDVSDNWQSETRRTVFRANLPLSILLLVISLILMVRGRHWVEQITLGLQERKLSAERWLVSSILSIGQILVPVAGIMAFSAAISGTGLMGARGELILDTLPEAGLMFFGARWIGGRMFPSAEGFAPPLNLNSAKRAEGRFHATLIGVMLLVAIPLRAAAEFAVWSANDTNVLIFPILVVCSLNLVRLAQLMLLHSHNVDAETTEPEYRNRLVRLLARAVAVLAVVGPVLAGVGYVNAGEAVVFPTIYSLALLALLVALQRLTRQIYVALTGDQDGVGDALAPVLAGFALVVMALPVFAMIWGARPTDLTELWTRFREGFAIGETRISPTDFLTFVVVFAIGYVLTRVLQGTLRTTVLPKTKMDVGGQNAIVSGTGYIGIFVAAVVAITSAGLDLSSLAIVAGALSVGIGFGLQNIVSNFVSGIILLIERPVSIGDWIEVGGKMGYVRDISVRSTRIETFDRTDVIVPNADLVSGTVTNWTRGNLVGRVIVPVGVAYGADTRKVEQILREVAQAQPMVLLNPAPFVYFKGFGADSLDFEVRAILRDVTSMLAVATEMNHQIYERFAQEGIEIPFAQRDIWIRNPEAMGLGPRVQAETAMPPQTKTVAAKPADGAQHLDTQDMPGSEGEGDR